MARRKYKAEGSFADVANNQGTYKQRMGLEIRVSVVQDCNKGGGRIGKEKIGKRPEWRFLKRHKLFSIVLVYLSILGNVCFPS